MKKICSVLLAFSIFMSVLPGVFAADTKKSEELLLEIKARIGDTDEYEEFSSEQLKNGDETIYNFHWSTNGDGEYKYMSVSCNENAVITSYYNSGDSFEGDRFSLNKPSTNEAMEAAKAHIFKLNPDICENIQITSSNAFESLDNNGYFFMLNRVENGVPVLGNSGTVRLSADCSEIQSFNINYDSGMEFKAPENIITKDDALSLYKEKIGLVPSYKYRYDGEKREVYLSYEPEEKSTYIDAFSSQKLGLDYNSLYNNNMSKEEAAMDMALTSGGGTRLSKAEESELQKVKGLIGQKEAEKIIRDNKYLPLTDDFSLQSLRLTSDRYDKDEYYYYLEFRKESENNYAYYYVTVNAKDGSLISFSGYDSQREKEQKDVLADTKKARELIKILSGEKFEQFEENENVEKNSAVSYTRKINGLDFVNNTIGADVLNGELVRYNINYSDVVVPSPENAITEDEAFLSLVKNVDFGLYYVPAMGKYNLAYGFDENRPCEIDAFSGKLLQNGKEYKKQAPQEYLDIEDHFAENEIKTLAKFGISFEGEEFKPDDKILQKDFISLLISTFYNYSPIVIKSEYAIDDVYNTAMREGIIKKEEKNPDAKVSRSMAAVFIIRALGIDEYASLPDIFVCPFSDVTENKGHISILGAMGVFKGDENKNFLPDKQMTRAEAAVFIYNYLSR